MKNSAVRILWGKPMMILCCVALVFFLSGCLDDDNKAVDPVPVGYVSIYHASPDAPALDVIVDDKRVNSEPFDYSDYSGYLNFYTGARNVKFSVVNASNALLDTTLSVEEDKAYSIFVINRLSSIETLVVSDSIITVPAGKAVVRFVHLSPDAPAIDVTENTGGAAWFTNTSFKQATDFKEVDAGSYSFKIKAAGTDNVLLSADNIDLRSGGYYTIVTRGFSSPPTGNTNVLSVEVL